MARAAPARERTAEGRLLLYHFFPPGRRRRSAPRSRPPGRWTKSSTSNSDRLCSHRPVPCTWISCPSLLAGSNASP